MFYRSLLVSANILASQATTNPATAATSTRQPTSQMTRGAGQVSGNIKNEKVKKSIGELRTKMNRVSDMLLEVYDKLPNHFRIQTHAWMLMGHESKITLDEVESEVKTKVAEVKKTLKDRMEKLLVDLENIMNSEEILYMVSENKLDKKISRIPGTYLATTDDEGSRELVKKINEGGMPMAMKKIQDMEDDFGKIGAKFVKDLEEDLSRKVSGREGAQLFSSNLWDDGDDDSTHKWWGLGFGIPGTGILGYRCFRRIKAFLAS